MKNLILLTLGLLCSLSGYSQCENAYFPSQEGVRFEMTNYKANGKEIGKVKSEITSTEGNSMIVSTNIYDKKSELVSEGEYEVICEDDKIRMDMQRFIPDELLESYEDMEMTVEGDFLVIPNNLEAGQSLPDGSGKVIVKMGSSGMDMNTTMNMTFTARNVEKKETITTPAGTFETFKITQTTISTFSMMGMSRETTYTSASWVSAGIGTVRAENYDKKGELNGYTLLTNFEK